MTKRNPYAAERMTPFTNREMQTMTGVSLMSLHLWRQGTVTKSILPSSKGPDGRVQYPVKRTLRWLERYGIEPVVHPDDVAENERGAKRKKSGPIRPKHPDRRPMAYRQ